MPNSCTASIQARLAVPPLFGLLGIRIVDGPTARHLAEGVFDPLGMTDTALWVPAEKLDRLPAAYRHDGAALVEAEPAGGGFYAGPPPFDVSHGELVSTARDFYRFARMLAAAGRVDGEQMISADHLLQMISDQVPADSKTPESFFPGCWDAMGWGFGVGVQTERQHVGRYGWSGGQGTNFFVDPDGTVTFCSPGRYGAQMGPMVEQFQALHQSSR